MLWPFLVFFTETERGIFKKLVLVSLALREMSSGKTVWLFKYSWPSLLFPKRHRGA